MKGVVPVRPKSAKNIELYAESLDDIRSHLIEEIHLCETARLRDKNSDDVKLKQRLAVLRRHLQQVNEARRNPGWRPFSVTFKQCAKLMLDDRLFAEIEAETKTCCDQKNDLEELATRAQKAAEQLEELLALTSRSSAKICATHEDISPLLTEAIKQLRQQQSAGNKFLAMINAYQSSRRFVQVAFGKLSDQTLNTLYAVSNRDNRHIKFKHLVKQAGGKKAFKSLSENTRPDFNRD